MDDDRSWEIMLLEIEAENEEIINNFYLERMRPRDIEELVRLIQGQQGQDGRDTNPIPPAYP